MNEPLTLNDIYVGDYIQVWMDIPGKWSMPMYISGIFSDGDLYLNFDGNEADPWESEIGSVYDIPIDYGILPHFGFAECEHNVFRKEVGKWELTVGVTKIKRDFHATVFLYDSDSRKFPLILGEADTIRKLQHFFYDETREPLKLTFE